MRHTKPEKSLWRLFSSMFFISAFTFGGGFVIVTLMKRKFVDEYHWLDDQEMLDVTALSQSAPGAIAVNAAILVGRYLRGIPGMLVSVLGTILPPLITLTFISYFYEAFIGNPYIATVLKGMQSGVVAIIADVACTLGGGFFVSRDYSSVALLCAAFIAAFVFKVNAVYIILFSAGIGGVKAIVQARRRKA